MVLLWMLLYVAENFMVELVLIVKLVLRYK
jgi:hypothetical protein